MNGMRRVDGRTPPPGRAEVTYRMGFAPAVPLYRFSRAEYVPAAAAVKLYTTSPPAAALTVFDSPVNCVAEADVRL